MKQLFILYDGRARSGATDRAAVLVSASSMHDAKKDCRLFHGYDAVWYVYDVDGENLVNEKRCPELDSLL